MPKPSGGQVAVFTSIVTVTLSMQSSTTVSLRLSSHSANARVPLILSVESSDVGSNN